MTFQNNLGRKTARLVAGGLIAAFVAACGGGDSDSGGSAEPGSGAGEQDDTARSDSIPMDDAPPAAETNWTTASFTSAFDDDKAAAIRKSARFRSVDADLVGKGSNQSHPYELIKLDVAHGAGLTGAGQTIAIVDDGFLTSHVELARKTLSSFGDVSIKNGSDHGTHVAALAAGRADRGEILGVAPQANLHLSSFVGTSLSGLAAATLDAAAQEAVAQNNSWGFIDRDGDRIALKSVQDEMSASTDAISALSKVVGGTAGGWRDWSRSLDTFQETGVVVFAMANEDLGDVDVMGGLPVLLPELNEAWLSVANGYFEVNSNREIVNAELLSTPCGQAASFCLAADGTTYSAGIDTNDSYQIGTGASFAAPMVSGSVALVAEAFPNLTPAELSKRLLASADNSFFKADGETDFGNGVVKGWSYDWGHGVLDLQAALSPIGPMAVVSGVTLSTAARHDAADTTLGVSEASGDGMRRALDGRKIALFDAMNGDFYVDAASFVKEAPRNGSLHQRRMARFMQAPNSGKAEPGSGSATFGFQLTSNDSGLSVAGTDGYYTMSFARAERAGMAGNSLGFSSSITTGASMLSFAQDTTSFVGRYETGFGAFEHFAFTGEHVAVTDARVHGVGGVLSFEAAGADLRFGLSHVVENGAFMGMATSEAFGLEPAGANSALSVAFSAPVTSSFSLSAAFEQGIAIGDAQDGGLIGGVGPVSFNGFEVAATAKDMFQTGDSLRFSVSQPLRIASGTIDFDLPVGRTRDGRILYDKVSGSLEPSGRQIDLGLSYAYRPTSSSSFSVSAAYSLDDGHIEGRTRTSIGAAYALQF